MLKRLLIATLVVGLVFTISIPVFADNPVNSYGDPAFVVNPNHPKLDEVTRATEIQPAMRLDETTLKVATGAMTPKASVPAPFCDNLSYYAGNVSYFWALPDADWDNYGTRFTSDAGIACTVMVAWVYMYGTAMTGDPDLSVTLYDDDGFGFPGTALETIVVPNASLPPGIGWVGVNFNATNDWVFGDYFDDVNYHVVYDVVQNSADDTLAILSGNGTGPFAGDAHSYGYLPAATGYVSFLSAYALDIDIIQDVDRCCYDVPFSDCNFQAWHENPFYIWPTPHNVFGDSEWSTRFSVSGPETLKSVRVMVYDRSATRPPPYFFGDDDLYIKVYDDDGSGFPGTLVHTETVLGGTYPAFPAWTNVPMSVPLVFEDDFHVTFSTSETFGSGDYEVLMGDDGATGNGGGFLGGQGRTAGAGDPTYAGGCGTATWYTMPCWWGLDAGFFMEAELCKDQFAVCEQQNWFTNLTTSYPVPDPNPLTEWAQRFQSSGEDCRVDELEIWFDRSAAFDGGRPLMYTKNTNVNIYADDAGGEPGTLLSTIVLTPADYAAAGYTGPGFFGTFSVTIDPNFIIGGNAFWVGIEPLSQTRDTGIRIELDNLGGTGNNFGLAAWIGGGSPGWLINPFFGGWADDAAMNLRAKICCIPFSETDCASLLPDPNWNEMSHDQARTGRSGNSIGDSWCDLNLVWNYESLTGRTLTTGSTVYDGIVACSFGDHYAVFDLDDGTVLYSRSLGLGYEIGTDLRCAPFITPVGTLAGQVVMFVGGGTEQSIYAFDLYTGAEVWRRAFTNVTLAGLFGATRFVAFTYYPLLDGVTDVIIWTTETGRTVAANAANGTLFKTPAYPGGWAVNPVSVIGGFSPFKSGCSDGTSTFLSTGPQTVPGDLYSLDAATGTINWQLSVTGPLQGVALWTAYGGIDAPAPSNESFGSGISYESGRLYAFSFMAIGEHPSEGAFYRINAADGSLIDGVATLAQPGTFAFGTPIIDANRIYTPGISKWLVNPNPGSLNAYSKSTGAFLWTSEGPSHGGYRVDGALTCEPDGGDDQVLVFDDEGLFRVVSSFDGNELWRRRVHSPGGGANDQGASIAIATDADGDTWVLASDNWGNLMAMEKQEGEDRPRLEIQTYHPEIEVEFGFNVAYPVSLGPILVNTGCADLTISSLTGDVNAPADPSVIPNFSAQLVDPDVAFYAATLSNQLTNNGFEAKVKNAKLQNFNSEMTSREELSREVQRTNKAASAPPVWLVNITTDEGDPPIIIEPGDTNEVILIADQTQISRGPYPLYITVGENDPDNFLNGISNPTNPEVIAATVVGGCLLDTTTLEFGTGGANFQWVSNCGRIGTGDWVPAGIEVDGESNFIFQGTYIFGVSPFRIAIHVQDWGAGDEAESWISWQPDPNFCDDQCKAAIAPAVLNSISSDGLTYDDIDGHIVCKSGVDSVQNFFDGSTWDWTLYKTAPFDNDSTMGLYINSRVAGADDGTPLTTNVTVEIFEFTERNGQDVPNWKFGAHIDCDIIVDAGGDFDTTYIDRSISTAWASAYPAATHAFGWIKLPFGCVEGGWNSLPVKNVVPLDSDQGLFEDTLKYDSFYFYMSQPAGDGYGHDVSAAPQDQQFLTTLVEHDFTANETFEFASVMFARNDLTNSHSSAELVDQALFANKWVGFGRGDVNNDDVINIADIMYLKFYLLAPGTNPGPIPFMHLGDVNADGNVDPMDLDYLIAYYFECGPCPMGDWMW